MDHCPVRLMHSLHQEAKCRKKPGWGILCAITAHARFDRLAGRSGMFRCIATLATLALASAVATTAEPEKLTQKEAEGLIFQSWREVSVEQNGKKTEGGLGIRFFPHGTQAWVLRGELAPSHPDPGSKILIDASVIPMRIDFIYVSNKEKWVSPGIFKYEKEMLIIVEPKGSTKYRKDGNYEIRPTSFEPDKKNKYTKQVLKKCEYLEQD